MALGLKTKLFLLGFAVLCPTMLSQADPMLCSRIYKLGGPYAMLNASECSYLKPTDPETVKNFCLVRSADNVHEYHYRYFCGLQLDIPLAGDKGTEGVRIVGSAVFSLKNRIAPWDNDSHLMALMKYFSRHEQLLAQTKPFTGESTDLFHLKLLKEALIRTAKDMNAIFTSEASKRKHASGKTAMITLSRHGHILVAHIGHPKTAVWSMKLRPWREDKPMEADALKLVESSRRTSLVVKELTKNHRQDGRDWIQSAFNFALGFVDVSSDRGSWRRHWILSQWSSIINKIIN